MDKNRSQPQAVSGVFILIAQTIVAAVTGAIAIAPVAMIQNHEVFDWRSLAYYGVYLMGVAAFSNVFLFGRRFS